MIPKVEYLPDREVDAALDKALRDLFTVCFTKKQDTVFRYRRYFIDPYPHRWVIRGAGGKLVAHTGVHEKYIETGDRVYRVGGLCEVCVHPDQRGRGYVKLMLAQIHKCLAREGFDFTLLFGDPAVYSSSGYLTVTNICIADPAAPQNNCDDGGFPVMAGAEKITVTGMVRLLRDRPWPETMAYLPGKKF